jgi:hypothetical protein
MNFKKSILYFIHATSILLIPGCILAEDASQNSGVTISNSSESDQQISVGTTQQNSGISEKATPQPIIYKYPYDEEGKLIFLSDKEFHQKDCTGYRDHYNIKRSVLPCASDEQLYLIQEEGYLGADSTSNMLYIGYEKIDEYKFLYHTKIDVDIWFLPSGHRSKTEIKISGVETKKVLESIQVDIFLWNYYRRDWGLDSEILIWDNMSTNRSKSPEKELDVTIGLDLWVSPKDSNEDSNGKMNITSIIHNEEVFQIKIKTLELGSDKYTDEDIIIKGEHTYNVPTPALRKGMHRAWAHRDE